MLYYNACMTEASHRFAGKPTPAIQARPLRTGHVSALAASAAGRLLICAPVVAFIWAGVYWALA